MAFYFPRNHSVMINMLCPVHNTVYGKSTKMIYTNIIQEVILHGERLKTAVIWYIFNDKNGRLWLRCRASVLLLEARWFDSPGLHVEVSLGKWVNPKLLLMCWSPPCMAATAISAWIFCQSLCLSLLKTLKCNSKRCYPKIVFVNYFDQW